jgi:4-hydroxy-3-methylbut-2-enyl diphosphate reductase
LFVAGKASSNGKVLFDVAKASNPRTFFMETTDDLDPAWIQGAERIGISGATSTPQWYMEEVKSFVERLAAADLAIA